MLSIFKIAGIIAIFQMVLLILFFNSKKNRSLSNQLLSAILLVYTMQICAIAFMSSFPFETLIKYSLFPALFNQFAFLFGPLLLFYSKAIIGEKIKKWEFIHLLPFTLVLIFMAVIIIAEPTFPFWFSTFRYYTSGLILIQSLIYILVTAFKIFRNFNQIKKYFNNSIHSQALFGFILVGLILLWVLKFNTFLFMDIWKRYGVCPITTSSYFVTGFLFFNILVYIALIKPDLFIGKKKYLKTNLHPFKKQEIIDIIQKNLEGEKLYSDSALTLTYLSKKTGISVPYLSQVINEEYNLSFPEFINSYRIREATVILKNNQLGYTVQQIMYEVGFNSKSAFNTAFKKYTGFTPSEFRQKQYN